MKIAVTASGPSQDAALDPRFGRCAWFVLVDTDDKSFEAIENPNVSRGNGAGIQSAQLMANKGIKVVLTGKLGPNAHQAFAAAGIDVFVECRGTVAEVVDAFKSGTLRPAVGPNAESHAGMSAGGRGRW